MSQTRIKRSYDSLQSSSAPFSSSSSLESAYKRSRLPGARQMSEDDGGESMMLQLSPTAASPSSPSSSQPQHLSASASALSHDAITSDALRLSSAPASSASSSPSSAAARPSGSSSSSSYRHPSPFVSRSAFDVSAFVDSFPVKRRRAQSGMDDGQQPASNKQHIAGAAASASPALPSSSSPSSISSPSPVFSLEQVKRIVSNALQLQEERLRDEYNSVLNELLREQFENFERFNKDYISRQISKTELSYLS